MWWLWLLVGFIIGCAATYIWFIVKLLNCKIEEGTPSASRNSSSRQWPKLHKIKENVTPCGIADGSNFHDAAVWYYAVKQTYLYLCNILGHSPR